MPHLKSLFRCRAGIAGAVLCLLAPASFAADRPGIDRPIRVGMFKGGVPDGRFWHTNIHTAHTVMASLLAAPATENLGDSLVVPPAGFTFLSGQVAQNTTGTGECAGNGCKSTPEQIKEFMRALDTLDVVILHTIGLGDVITDSAERKKLSDFWATKGYVGIHKIADTYASWPLLDTVNGAKFRGHPSEQNGTVRRDSVFMHEPHWRYLNQGLF